MKLPRWHFEKKWFGKFPMVLSWATGECLFKYPNKRLYIAPLSEWLKSFMTQDEYKNILVKSGWSEYPNGKSF